MPWQLIVALVLNAVMQTFACAAYAARIAGVRTGQIAIAISLFSLVVTVSRTANMFYAPMIGTLSDAASRGVGLHIPSASTTFAWQMRGVLLAGTVGAILGASLIPLFTTLYVRGIESFNRTDSMLRSVLRLFDPIVVNTVFTATRFAKPSAAMRFPLGSAPSKLLFANLLFSAVSAVGVVAATYASVIDPSEARTALLLSSIVNGFGTIAMAFIVDPTSAQIVDRAVKGERTMHDVQAMVFWLAVTSIAGTLLSQVLLVPAAMVIAAVARVLHQ